MTGTQLSIVIPIFNEEKILPVLFDRLSGVLKQLNVSYEVIFVDDGSIDNSLTLLKEFARDDSRIKIIRLSRNFGHQPALTAGLNRANGKAVILMDGDLQDPPEVIPELVQKWRNGYDVVYVVRKKRRESIIKVFIFGLFYRLLNQLSQIKMPLNAGIFSLLDRKVVDVLKNMPERNRYLSGLRTYAGFKQVGIESNRNARYDESPRQTLPKLIKLALDGIFSFSFVPLRVATFIGFLISISSFLILIFFIYLKITDKVPISGWVSIMVAILFLGGIELITLGIIGEYIGRIYDEVKKRPYYIEEEKINF